MKAEKEVEEAPAALVAESATSEATEAAVEGKSPVAGDLDVSMELGDGKGDFGVDLEEMAELMRI